MIDLKLDRNTHDLVIENGDLQFVTGSDQTAQYLKIRLLAYLGEWFLDITLGTPYFEKILGKTYNLRNQAAVIRRRILQTEGVTGINTFDFEKSGRELEINSNVELDGGENTTISIGV